MGRLGMEQHVAFYNCGIQSGSSQPYRHIQIIPQPRSDEFVFFPDRPAFREKLSKLQGPLEPPISTAVPFICLVASIASKSASEVSILYQDMLKSLESRLGEALVAHNLVFTSHWLCIIPRRRARVGNIATNSMGMMGLVWVASEEEREGWNSHGLSKLLIQFGYPLALSKG
jgi:ATP adenylyltransferase